MVSPIASGAFSSYPSSGENERSFKTRSRTHNKTRNRLGDDRTDVQPFCLFNSAQPERANTVLSAKRASLIELCMLRGVESEEGRRFLRKVGALAPDEAGDCDFTPESDVCNVIKEVGSDLDPLLAVVLHEFGGMRYWRVVKNIYTA